MSTFDNLLCFSIFLAITSVLMISSTLKFYLRIKSLLKEVRINHTKLSVKSEACFTKDCLSLFLNSMLSQVFGAVTQQRYQSALSIQ